MNYTIIDIANISGVSKSTVSRVISNSGYVSPAAREKVLTAIEKLQYKPNAVARAMVSRHTKNIGVIIYRQHHPIASHPFYGKILDAILEKASELGYSIFVMTDKEITSKSADFLLEKRVDGLILISRLNQELIDYFKSSQIPFVMVNGTSDDSNVIHLVNDDERGGELAAEHMLSLGLTRIAVFAGPQEHRSHFLRLKGFRKTYSQNGYEVDENHIYYADSSQFEEGYKAFQSIWERSHNLQAIFATNDMIALGVIKAIYEKGMQVPKDIAVVGFDDIDYAAMSNPSLTTVHSAKTRMGHEAVLMLDEWIHGNTRQTKMQMFTPELKIRNSTKIEIMEGLS
ncbi:LacI family DNA-binding transcriptional regulator [Paenibacillus wynnii]|uniref:LacI family DNA-binding transcriptional regulator n=1 Tax=Paenibacillus wynnii TaxID=268407 RepID=UPI00278DB255|nr:LacI family DNA-binding transcriptional regulator [Paenibacillus wynnii]MDQ0193614.1 LacI family transcriptional regulator/LacI family purine nucleotide synthesis repressor [Paenibacillus wynnii]